MEVVEEWLLFHETYLVFCASLLWSSLLNCCRLSSFFRSSSSCLLWIVLLDLLDLPPNLLTSTKIRWSVESLRNKLIKIYKIVWPAKSILYLGINTYWVTDTKTRRYVKLPNFDFKTLRIPNSENSCRRHSIKRHCFRLLPTAFVAVPTSSISAARFDQSLSHYFSKPLQLKSKTKLIYQNKTISPPKHSHQWSTIPQST